MIRIAATGLGFMGHMHLGVYASLPDVMIAALCDRLPGRLEAGGLQTQGNFATTSEPIDLSAAVTYTDFDTMLAAGGFDAVDLSIPTDLHAEFAVKSLRAGYHVFVEKPLALTYDSAKEIARIADESGRVCSVGQCLRFWPLYTEVKKIIDSGRYGSVRHAEFGRYSPPADWASEGWLGDSRRSGNASLDLHIHDVDMILHLFGPPQSVRSVGVPDGQGYFSHLSTVYRYPDLSVTSTGGWGLAAGYPFNMRALYVLEMATIEMDISRDSPLVVYTDDGDEVAWELPEGDGYRHEIIDFIDCCSRGTASPLVNPSIAAESVRIAELEIRSARENREIATA